MTDQELIRTEGCVRRALNRRWENMSGFAMPNLLALLMGLDTYYNAKASGKLRIQKGSVKGGKAQLNNRTGNPIVRGVNANSDDFASFEVPLTRNFDWTAGTKDSSSYHGAEPLSRKVLNKYTGENGVVSLTQELTDGFHDAYMTALDADLWPATDQVGGGGNPAQEDAIEAATYALQSGYAANALTGTGVYTVNGIDYNTRPNMKALNYGGTGGTTTCSVSNIRKYVTRPLRQRGAKIDLMLAGSLDYEYLLTQAEDPIRYPRMQELEFGGEFCVIDGCWVVYEPGLDRATYTQIPVFDSSTLFFGTTEEPGEGTNWLAPGTVPGKPALGIMQYYGEFCYAVKNSRKCGRLFNTTRP